VDGQSSIGNAADMPLEDYRIEPFTADGITHDVYHRGEGPCVVVAAEIPGITSAVTAFADELVAVGLSVAMPSMFGTPGKRRTERYVLASAARSCISREFHVLATQDSSPATAWLRALARNMHAAHGGPGVGFVGMCFTGGFGMAMLLDDAVVAPVLSQPSLPFGLGADRKASVGLNDDELARAAARAADGCPVMGLRFTGDSLVPDERFATLRTALGDNFIGVEITSPDAAHGIDKQAHSVLTEERSTVDGHPTKDAFDQVVGFLQNRLQG
jgi:dienelactone hydrolase